MGCPPRTARAEREKLPSDERLPRERQRQAGRSRPALERDNLREHKRDIRGRAERSGAIPLGHHRSQGNTLRLDDGFRTTDRTENAYPAPPAFFSAPQVTTIKKRGGSESQVFNFQLLSSLWIME